MLMIALLWVAFIVCMGMNASDSMAIGVGRKGMAWQRPAAQALFYLDVWCIVAALALAYVGMNPNRWRNLTRLTIGTTAIGMMLGRAVGGTIATWLAMTQAPDWAQFLAAPFALSMTGAGMIFAVAGVLGLLFAVLVFVPVVMANQLMSFERQIAIFGTKAGGLSARISRLVYWLRNESEPPAPPDETKGARFATAEEMDKAVRPGDPRSIAYGHSSAGVPLALPTEKHVLVMASTRSGKGVSLIIPHLLRYTGSAFVLDPKGENAKATGRQRAKLNKVVHYLDPFGITGKPQSRFNPLSRFTPDNMEAESKALAAALFLVGEKERDHWNAAGQQLLAALILYVYAEPGLRADQKDLVTVRKLLLGNIVPTLEAMQESDIADGLLGSLARSFLDTPEKERGSIISTAQRQTEILDNPQIAACLRASGPGKELNFAAWHRGTMTVYLSLSAPKFPTFARWLRLVLTSALDEMTDQLTPPKLPVCFMLDELATLGHLQPVENAIGLAAGYGVQLVSVFQDIAQMKDLYKSRWASFIGNSGVRAVFNLDDYDTAKYWSNFVGGRVAESRSRRTDQYGMSQGGEGISESMRPLLSPEKIMFDFAEGKMLVLAQGLHPIITDRVPYYDPRLKDLAGLWDDPRSAVQPRATTKPAAAPAQAARPTVVPFPDPKPVRATPERAPAATPAQAANDGGSRPGFDPFGNLTLHQQMGFQPTMRAQAAPAQPREPDPADMLRGFNDMIDRLNAAEKRARSGR